MTSRSTPTRALTVVSLTILLNKSIQHQASAANDETNYLRGGSASSSGQRRSLPLRFLEYDVEEDIEDPPLYTSLNNYLDPSSEYDDIDNNLISIQIPSDTSEYATQQDKYELILKGDFVLSSINIPIGSLAEDSTAEDYANTIRADFCMINFDQQKDDPSLVPQYRDIVGSSTHCSYHSVSYPLVDVVRDARIRDIASTSSAHSMDVEAFIFHQPKSGSGVVANVISAAIPDSSRLIEHSSIISNVLKACNSNPNECSQEKQIKLLQDVIYMLGRTGRNEETKLYVRGAPSDVSYIHIVKEAFPTVKWLYVYRESNAVLSKTMNSKGEKHNCLKNRRNPSQGLIQYVQDKKGDADLNNLSDEHLCSALLATQFNLVLQEQEQPTSNNSGLFVNYDEEISNGSFDNILDYLNIDATNKHTKDRIQEQKHKTSNSGKGEPFQQEEQETITTDNIKKANEEFLNNEIGSLNR